MRGIVYVSRAGTVRAQGGWRGRSRIAGRVSLTGGVDFFENSLGFLWRWFARQCNRIAFVRQVVITMLCNKILDIG